MTSTGRFAVISIGTSTASTSRSAGQRERCSTRWTGSIGFGRKFHNLTNDLNHTAAATHQLLGDHSSEYRHLEGDPGHDANHLQLVRQPDRSVRPADRHERRDGQVLQRLSGGEPVLRATRDLPEPGLQAGRELDDIAGRQGCSLHHHSRGGSGDDGGNRVRRSGAPSGQGGAETHLAAERRHLPRRYGRDVLRHRQTAPSTT